MKEYDVIVVGAGPAGLAAACEAYQNGAERVLVVERDKEPGGILNQCIHSGFGLHYFKEELTGPEYAGRFIDLLRATGAELLLDTMVLHVSEEKEVTMVNPRDGCFTARADAVILTMGCRERTRGAIGIPGTRPAGVFTAGMAQRYVNIEGYMVGRKVVILGSGDIGLIMARRMTLEGAKVAACVELMPYSNGLGRNIVQCLDDFGIPLYLSHTITEIRGERRVEGVVVSRVDGRGKPVPGTERFFDCDTVLLSVGLIPENELSKEAGIELDPRTKGPAVYENMETSVPGIFACGNVVHVHDLVDFVTAESRRAGAAAARFCGRADAWDPFEPAVPLENGENVGYTVPQHIRPGRIDRYAEVFFRVKRVFGDSVIEVSDGGKILSSFRRDHMAPGEMEHIVIPKRLLQNAGKITVSAKEGKRN
ncbi:MAG TPA: pyridine nucleotide-disulfide oxidoreductase [Ruminococcaceae bacterium]|jgi:NADPH-dependent 2,4-dienoyl-CoA reductase/sulfur reductase-like enzyme|nr:pyridine nucleotide-disulfide oxidoreductase [Oscillospiraceae bacterium]